MIPTHRAWAPGRVNLIGEHTDYTGGMVLPMAIDLGTEIRFRTLEDRRISLISVAQSEPLALELPVIDPAAVRPDWGRYIAGVAEQLGNPAGIEGVISSTVPLGSGLSSSAALEVAVALALGADGSAVEIAEICQAAEHRASGVPCGIMDQLASAGGVEGHALLIDCSTRSIDAVAVPSSCSVAVIHSGQHRGLDGSAYAERVVQCAAAEAIIGPLCVARIDAWRQIADPLVAARARHVISENARVRAMAIALADGNLPDAGALMMQSHASLRDDYGVSTSVLDELVEYLAALPGVHGARLTGAGFGGCVVALCDTDVDPRPPGSIGWIVHPSTGAFVEPL